jgi:hypothetical protein
LFAPRVPILSSVKDEQASEACDFPDTGVAVAVKPSAHPPTTAQALVTE